MPATTINRWVAALLSDFHLLALLILLLFLLGACLWNSQIVMSKTTTKTTLHWKRNKTKIKKYTQRRRKDYTSAASSIWEGVGGVARGEGIRNNTTTLFAAIKKALTRAATATAAEAASAQRATISCRGSTERKLGMIFYLIILSRV